MALNLGCKQPTGGSASRGHTQLGWINQMCGCGSNNHIHRPIHCLSQRNAFLGWNRGSAKNWNRNCAGFHGGGCTFSGAAQVAHGAEQGGGTIPGRSSLSVGLGKYYYSESYQSTDNEKSRAIKQKAWVIDDTLERGPPA